METIKKELKGRRIDFSVDVEGIELVSLDACVLRVNRGSVDWYGTPCTAKLVVEYCCTAEGGSFNVSTLLFDGVGAYVGEVPVDVYYLDLEQCKRLVVCFMEGIRARDQKEA